MSSQKFARAFTEPRYLYGCCAGILCRYGCNPFGREGMTMNRLASALLTSVLSLSLAIADAGAAPAQGLNYPPSSLPNYGGAIGVGLDTQRYEQNGVPMFKLISIGRNSPLYGYAHVGDFIYNVNGYYVQTTDDIVNVIHSGSPGTFITISYLDVTDNFRAKSIKVTLIRAPEQQQARAQEQQQAADSRPWCDQSDGQHTACIAGAAIAVGLLMKIIGDISSSGDSSGSQSSGRSSDSRFKPDTSSNKPADQKPVDNGVGCFWGYQSTGTCH
jgi:hypothetical protein